jgi:two-component system, cell cycle sensor histidine kinase and response regulator CckA
MLANPLVLGLAENLLYLLVVFVYDLLANGRAMGGRAVKQIGVGVVIGLVAVGTMLTSLQYEPGLVFDARSVVLGVTGLFFGTLVTLSAVLVAAAYRISQGGAGMLTGVLVIVSSGAIGILWRSLRGGVDHRMRARELFAFGVVVHLTFLALLLTLPDGRGFEVLPLLAPPVLALFPLATLLLAGILVRRMRRERDTERLVESEARYRILFEESPSAMLLLDPTRALIEGANRAACEFYGYPPEDLRGKPLSEIDTLPERGLPEALAPAVSGERSSFDFRHVLADGSIRDVEVQAGPIPIEGRTLLHFTIRDVTQQRRAQLALRKQGESLRLLSAALEAAANPIVVTNRKGVIEWVNHAFTELTGYPRKEALGRAPGEVIGSGRHEPAFFQELWERITSGEVWEGEMVNRKRDGTIYREHQTITPVRDSAGEITHFIAIKQDLTERLALEEQLLQAQKMQAIGRFAGGIAHDFNNLLTIMTGSAQLGIQMSEPDSEIRGEFEQILETGRRASHLTQQILSFSRQDPVAQSVLDLNGVIRQSHEFLARLIRDSVTLEFDLCEDPLPVVCSLSRIEQILLNLVANAVDAMAERGGRLTIATRVEQNPRALGRSMAPGDRPHVVLTVTDTGIGMPPEIQGRIFDPFFTTKEEGKGTGLGLATVYGIVTQSGGEVAVESTPGEGSAFRVVLPMASGQTASPAPVPRDPGMNGNGSSATKVVIRSQAGESPEGEPGLKNGSSPGGSSKRCRILLAEDDFAIRRVATRILEREGFEVIGVTSGEEALRMIEEGVSGVDLVLTDVVLPGMTGPEFVTRIRSRSPAVRVLFMSGYAEAALADHGLDPAEQTFLSKPYTVDGLISRVREVLEGH